MYRLIFRDKNLVVAMSIEGSGVEHVWLETGTYGPSVIQTSISNADHYDRSLDAEMTLTDAMKRLLLNEFFKTTGVEKYVMEFGQPPQCSKI